MHKTLHSTAVATNKKKRFLMNEKNNCYFIKFVDEIKWFIYRWKAIFCSNKNGLLKICFVWEQGAWMKLRWFDW